MTADKKLYHEKLAESVIQALQEGTAPWVRPWEPGSMPDPPVNAVTEKPYRGINRIWLSMVQGDALDNRWCTYKQAQEIGAQVKKGSHGTSIQYWQFHEKRLEKDENGKPVLGEDGEKRYVMVALDRPRVFFATVFHASQIENMPPLPVKNEPEHEWQRLQAAENILINSGAKIYHDQANSAFYRKNKDEIHLPKKEQFLTADKYYVTALHELGHWTGHESRLARDLKHPFGSEGYAREELRAELASYMLGAELGIGHDPGQHHSYIKSWIKVLESDPNEIFRAARDADKIKEYVMAKEIQQEQPFTQPIDQLPPTKEEIKRKKIYLNVPYTEKEEAKTLGARWDRNQKSWYVPEGANMVDFKKWAPLEKKGMKEKQTLSSRQEFASVLQEAGLVVDGDPIMDGKIHRVPVIDSKKGAKDGAYCGYEDGRPNGWYQNHKTASKGKWIANGHILTVSAKQSLHQEVQADRDEIAEKAQKRAYAKWVNAVDAENHPYLKNKDIESAAGLKIDKQGNLMIPGYNLETGRLQTIQYINDNGSKWYEKDCPKNGAVALFSKDAMEGKEVVLVAEGYATGASLHHATGLPVVVAFDAGNLKDVAQAIHKKYPTAKITICADNDHNRKDGKNIGVEKAKEAAAAVNGRVIVPVFTKKEKEQRLTDFNDLHKSRGLHAVKEAVEDKRIER